MMPPRLKEVGTPFEAQLLRAGRDERPDVARRRALLASLGVAGAGVGVATVSPLRAWTSRVAAHAAKALSGTVAVVAGAAALNGETPAAVPPASHPPAVVAPVPRSAPVSVSAPALEDRITTVAVEDLPRVPPLAAERAAPSSSRPVTRAAPSPSSSPSSTTAPEGSNLDAELALLNQAKRALAAHQPTAALAALDGYARAFPRGVLAEEADVVRVEAAVASGDHAKAATLAWTFREKYPKSTYAQRMRALIPTLTLDE